MKVINALSKVVSGELSPDTSCKLIYRNGIAPTNYESIRQLFAYTKDIEELDREIEIIEEEKEISKITKEEFERLDKRTLLELIVKNQNELIDEVNKLKKGDK